MMLQELKKNFYFQNIKSLHFYYLLVLIILSFALQASNVRFYGFSVTLFLFLITSMIGLFYIKKIFLLTKNSIIFPILIYLIINFIFIQDNRILAILLCLGFYLYSTSQSLNYFQFLNLAKILYVVLIFLLIYAWYNFFDNFIFKRPGFYYASHFPFLSITYTFGSKGYDAYYLVLGSIFSYFFFLKSKSVTKLINLNFFFIFYLSILLSQSLSAYLILLFLAIFYFKFYLTILPIIIFNLFYFFIDIFFSLDLIEYRFSGNFNYSSSLEERFYIIQNYLFKFLDNPWGHGSINLIDSVWYHSENSFIDIIISYGIYGLFLLIMLFAYLIKNLKFSTDTDIKFVNMILFATLIFVSLHSSTNFYIIYLILVLIISMYKIKQT